VIPRRRLDAPELMLFGKLRPEGNFFELFNQHALHRRKVRALHAVDRELCRSRPAEKYTNEVARDGRPTGFTAE